MKSFSTALHQRSAHIISSDAKGRRGMAFIVEALLLLAFLVACLAVFMQLLGASGHLSQDATQLDAAVQAASNAAEQFSADPTSLASEQTVKGLSVKADTWSEESGTGTLYHATITVSDGNGEEVYQLTTAKYADGQGSQALGGVQHG